MSDTVFGWVKQLSVGDKGEKTFLSFYEGATKSEKDLTYDFKYQGETVELKTDTYSMEKTENFFMERYGDIDKGKIGGPWRAANDKVKYFVYFFIEEGVFFWFDALKLVEFLDVYTRTLKTKEIKNKRYTTVGFQIPREAVRHLVIRQDFIL